MIESMSSGTPVIAWNNGSVPEIIDDSESGFIVDTIEAAGDAVQKVRNMDRRLVRQAFEARFTVSQMTDNYLKGL